MEWPAPSVRSFMSASENKTGSPSSRKNEGLWWSHRNQMERWFIQFLYLWLVPHQSISERSTWSFTITLFWKIPPWRLWYRSLNAGYDIWRYWIQRIILAEETSFYSQFVKSMAFPQLVETVLKAGSQHPFYQLYLRLLNNCFTIIPSSVDYCLTLHPEGALIRLLNDLIEGQRGMDVEVLNCIESMMRKYLPLYQQYFSTSAL